MHRYPLGGRGHGPPRLLGDSEEEEGEKHQGDEKRPDDPLAVSRSPFPDLLVHDDPPSLPRVRRRLTGNSSRNRRVIPEPSVAGGPHPRLGRKAPYVFLLTKICV